MIACKPAPRRLDCASAHVRLVDVAKALPSQLRTGKTELSYKPKRRNVAISAKKVQATASPVKSTAGQSKISAEEAKTLYQDMFLGREFEEMCAQMYYRGKMFGFVHLYSGQEAVSTGRFCCSPEVSALCHCGRYKGLPRGNPVEYMVVYFLVL